QALPVLQQTGAPQTLDMVQLFAWVLQGFDDIKDAGRFFRPALVIPPELKEQLPGAEGEQPPGGGGLPPGPGAGLPPALAGQLAPAQLPQQPGVANPGEGLNLQDLLQSIRGGIQ